MLGQDRACEEAGWWLNSILGSTMRTQTCANLATWEDEQEKAKSAIQVFSPKVKEVIRSDGVSILQGKLTANDELTLENLQEQPGYDVLTHCVDRHDNQTEFSGCLLEPYILWDTEIVNKIDVKSIRTLLKRPEPKQENAEASADDSLDSEELD